MVLEDNQKIRLFPERLAYPLPSAVTVTGTDGNPKVLAQGTVVDSYYVHADWLNNGRNMPKTFDGSVTFTQPVYGVIKDSQGLINTHPILGASGKIRHTIEMNPNARASCNNLLTLAQYRT